MISTVNVTYTNGGHISVMKPLIVILTLFNIYQLIKCTLHTIKDVPKNVIIGDIITNTRTELTKECFLGFQINKPGGLTHSH